jgi:hypothetical protein
MPHLDLVKLAAHREAEAAAGWPLLRRCPNTFAIRALRYLDTLGPADRRAFVDTFRVLDRARARDPGTYHAAVMEQDLTPVFAAYRAGLSGGGDRRGVATLPVKVVAALRRDPVFTDYAAFARYVHWPEATALALHPPVLSGLDEIVPVLPRRLRKVMADRARQRLGAVPERLDSETTRLVGAHGEVKVALDISFAPGGAKAMHQMDHMLWLGPPGGGRLRSAGYESLWLLPTSWDYITEGYAEAAADCLCDSAILFSELVSPLAAPP